MKFKKKQPKMHGQGFKITTHEKYPSVYFDSISKTIKIKRSKKMSKTLEVKQDMVEKAMEKCPQFKEVAEELWPELKESKIESYSDIPPKIQREITRHLEAINRVRFDNEGADMICSKYILGKVCCMAISANLADKVRFTERPGTHRLVCDLYRKWTGYLKD